MAVVAVCALALGRMMAREVPAPGFNAALLALAVPLAVAGWAAHVTPAGNPSLRRDLLLGLSAGAAMLAVSWAL